MRALCKMIAGLMSVAACAATASLVPFAPEWAGSDDAEGLARVEIAPDGTVFIMR